MKLFASFGIAVAALCAGCASVTQGTTHTVRVDTLKEDGTQVDGADCTLTNDRGSFSLRSGTSTLVRRSGEDLHVKCSQAGLPDATASLISRANAGLAGNILLGGAIGAAIDAGSGAAFTYPHWVRVVFGQFAVFDRSSEVEGMPMMASGVASRTPVVAAAPAASVASAASTPSASDSAQPMQASTAPARAVSPGALAKGDTFDYRVTDRSTGNAQTVVLRVDRVEGGEVSFNDGARIEGLHGGMKRMRSALLGELDQVTPPGGWMPGGKLPAGAWKISHTSNLSGEPTSYDLDAYVEGEQKMRVAGSDMDAVRVALRGWVEKRAGMMSVRARYEAAAWVAPQLHRVVRFEVRSRSAGGYGGSAFQIDEVTDLVRMDRD